MQCDIPTSKSTPTTWRGKLVGTLSLFLTAGLAAIHLSYSHLPEVLTPYDAEHPMQQTQCHDLPCV